MAATAEESLPVPPDGPLGRCLGGLSHWAHAEPAPHGEPVV